MPQHNKSLYTYFRRATARSVYRIAVESERRPDVRWQLSPKLATSHVDLHKTPHPTPPTTAIKTIANEDRFALPNQAPYQHQLTMFPPSERHPLISVLLTSQQN